MAVKSPRVEAATLIDRSTTQSTLVYVASMQITATIVRRSKVGMRVAQDARMLEASENGSPPEAIAMARAPNMQDGLLLVWPLQELMHFL